MSDKIEYPYSIALIEHVRCRLHEQGWQPYDAASPPQWLHNAAEAETFYVIAVAFKTEGHLLYEFFWAPGNQVSEFPEPTSYHRLFCRFKFENIFHEQVWGWEKIVRNQTVRDDSWPLSD